MAERVICELCGRVVPPHAHYLVKIEVFADPTMPEILTEELEEKDLESGMKELLEEMKKMSAEELLDQVHRQFQFKICRPCQVKFLANPLGKPRQTQAGKN
jgi:hypothetical protein